ncbi:MAG: FAD-binding protein [Solirubrobacterales bacterium]|nr:FAD-binding protein [Solirubrobacterales bacterium]
MSTAASQAFTVDDRAVEALGRRLNGLLLTAQSPEFEDATRLWNGLIRKTPELVVRPADTADVQAAVGFAHEHGLAVSVRGGGHNIAGTALAEGGLTVDMSQRRAVIVDPQARTAIVEPGCLLADVDRETQAHGLATPLGFISEVGVAGLTLGGGLGYLTRRFGWTVDNLLEVEIVTADGRTLEASRERNEDLFWAIRGAGANLGVVTSLTLRLHEVGPAVYGGLIAWPFERAREILEAYRSLTATAPRELAVWMNLLRAPAAPFVPEAWQGELVAAMAVCYSGDLGAAGEALAPIRALPDPVIELLAEQPYTQMQSYLDDGEPKGDHYYWRSDYAAGLSDELLETWRELAAECPIPRAQMGLLHLGGALNECDHDDGAVGNRDARFALGAIGIWDPDEAGADSFPQWIREAGDRFRPFSTGGSYINFQTDDEGADRVRAMYGRNFERLLEIKRRYDPDNLFRSNRNIDPARGGHR